jgi:murein DD-endopeptidase MepM/ murein hydrolase activator NlpD
LVTWTHYHWDHSNAVDIEAARHLAGDSAAFVSFTQRPVVAIVNGVISIADNPMGGLALLLDGDDGLTYYYGHLSEQWVNDGQRVQVGDFLGRIGNTGRWTQYIEPHLHFSISTHAAEDWRWEPDVNGAEKLLAWFDLAWQDLDIPDYPLDQVAGWPLAVPAQITRGFAERQAENPDQGSIDIVPLNAGQDPIPVYATLGGEVNVSRATVMGLRVQITNRPARTTVVYSFMRETTLADGDVVQRGELVGYVAPSVSLNYMLFVNDVQTDPAPTLDD